MISSIDTKMRQWVKLARNLLIEGEFRPSGIVAALYQ
jgi:hypothetical protein